MYKFGGFFMKFKLLLFTASILVGHSFIAMEVPKKPSQEEKDETNRKKFEFLNAVRQGNLQKIQLLLIRGADVNELDENHESAIFIATQNYLKCSQEKEKENHFAIIKLLIQSKCNPLWNNLTSNAYELARNSKDKRLLKLIEPRAIEINSLYTPLQNELKKYMDIKPDEYFDPFITEDREQARTIYKDIGDLINKVCKDPESCNIAQSRLSLIQKFVLLAKMQKPSEQLKQQVQKIDTEYLSLISRLDFLNITTAQKKIIRDLIEINRKFWESYKNEESRKVDLLADEQFSRIVIKYIHQMQEINKKIKDNPDQAKNWPTAPKLFKQIINEWFFEVSYIGHIPLTKLLLHTHYANPNSKKAATTTQKNPLAHAILCNDLPLARILVQAGTCIDMLKINYFELAENKPAFLELLHKHNVVSDKHFHNLQFALYEARPLATTICYPNEVRQKAQALLTDIQKIKKTKIRDLEPEDFYRLKTLLPHKVLELKQLSELVTINEMHEFENKIIYIKQLLNVASLENSQEIEQIKKQVKDLEHMYIPNFTKQYMQKRVFIYLDQQIKRLEQLLPDYVKALELLFEAARTDSQTCFDEAIAQGANVHHSDAHGFVPLFTATMCGNAYIVKRLIAAGIDVNIRNKKGQTPLHFAVKSTMNIFNLLRAAGANIFARDEQGATILIEAVESGRTPIVELLFKAGAHTLINIPTNSGQTPLMHAAINGDGQIVDMLLAAGAEVNLRNSAGETALLYVLRTLFVEKKDYPEIVQKLLEAGAYINLPDNEFSTPLHHAIATASTDAHVQIILRLLQAGANVNVSNKFGITPLALALQKDTLPAIIDLLLAYKVDVNITLDKQNYTPLLSAIAQNKPFETISRLIDVTKNINYQAATGFNPLLTAALKGNTKVVQKLIAAKADLTIQRNGVNSLMTAVAQGSIEITKLLIEAGADMAIPNSPGQTILEFAVGLKNTPNKVAIIKFLEQKRKK